VKASGESLGLNLLIYPAPLIGPGRLRKIARSLQASGLFAQTHIVGIDDGSTSIRRTGDSGLPPDVRIEQIRGANIRASMGAVRIMAFWSFRVYRRYRREHLSAVAAQNVYMLPVAYHLARRTGAVFAYNAHELETEAVGARGIKQRIARIIERQYIRRTQVVSVVNEPIATWYANRYPGLRPVVATNTPVDDGNCVDLRSRLDVPDGSLLYIHVGFLVGGRSIPLLLRVFQAHPGVHLAFLGDGQLRPLVEDACAVAPNIHLLPAVPPESVVSMVRGADVGVCLIEPASLSDQLSTPNKLMEALAAGIPPLCSDLVEARRLLGAELSRTWILTDPESQLAEAIRRIGPDDLAQFTANWHGIGTWDEHVAELVEAYRNAVRTRVQR
jgi:glycosyltransferase involved in cell wall biosynthesis